MSLQIWIDGKRDGDRMTDAERREAQRLDDYTGALQDHFRNDKSDGTYGHMGTINGGAGSITAPKAMLGGITKSERMARVMSRMAAGEPPISLFFDEATETELLAVEDAEAYEEGLICPNCLQYQNIVANECNWRIVGVARDDPKFRGCGYRRDVI